MDGPAETRRLIDQKLWLALPFFSPKIMMPFSRDIFCVKKYFFGLK
jgi:hypothetical protein